MYLVLALKMWVGLYFLIIKKKIKKKKREKKRVWSGSVWWEYSSFIFEATNGVVVLIRLEINALSPSSQLTVNIFFTLFNLFIKLCYIFHFSSWCHFVLWVTFCDNLLNLLYTSSRLLFWSSQTYYITRFDSFGILLT